MHALHPLNSSQAAISDAESFPSLWVGESEEIKYLPWFLETVYLKQFLTATESEIK